jgi:AraC-like DNA-binding protein
VSFAPFVFRVKSISKYLDLFSSAQRIWDVKNIGYEMRCKALLYSIIADMQAEFSEKYIPKSKYKIIEPAVKYINENLFAINFVSEISDFLFVTETYLFKIFKEQLKISPKKYIVNKRLLVAQKMISSGKKPTEIYVECGFQTYPAFYKRYIEFFGYPPSKTP